MRTGNSKKNAFYKFGDLVDCQGGKAHLIQRKMGYHYIPAVHFVLYVL